MTQPHESAGPGRADADVRLVTPQQGAGPGSRHPAASPIVGRSLETDLLLAAAARVAGGHAQLFLVAGPAGIGKSAMVAAALDRLPHFRRITLAADESEIQLAYSPLDRLAAALAGQPPAAPPPTARRARRRSPVSVGAEFVRMLGEQELPLALVVEDAQWLDIASSQALQFALRRLAVEPVLVVVTTRGGRRPVDLAWDRLADVPSFGSRLDLEPLTSAEVGELAAAIRGRSLPPASVLRLHEETAGHPLHTRLVIEQLTWPQLVSPTVRLPVPRTLTDTVWARLGGLSAAAREITIAVAVLDAAASPQLAQAVSGVDSLPAGVEEAVAAGLLEESENAAGRRLRIPHPLLVTAVRDGLGAARRHAVHVAALRFVHGDAALNHRLAAAEGPDEELAADLEESATRLEAAGEAGLAASRLLAAADAFPGAEVSDRRLLKGIGLLFTAGDVLRAIELTPAVLACRPGARRSTILAGYAVFSGRFAEARRLVELARAEAAASGDQRLLAGADLLAAVVKLSVDGGGADEASGVLSNPGAPQDWRRLAVLLRSLSLGLAGRGRQGLALLAHLPARPSEVPAGQLLSLAGRGILRLWGGEEEQALADLRVVERAIRNGAPLVVFVPVTLAMLAEAELTSGSWDEAAAHADLAVSVAEGESRSVALCTVHSVAGRLHADRGDWSRAAHSVETARRWALVIPSPANRTYAAIAAATLARARGDGHAMMTALDTAGPEAAPCRRGQWRVLRAQALLTLGRIEEAERMAGEVAAEAGSVALEGRLVQAEASLVAGDVGAARGHVTRVAEAIPMGAVFLRARMELVRAAVLAQAGRGSGREAALRRAHHHFSALGARPWALRCEQVLADAGGTDPDWRYRGDLLSERERQVAHLVAQGMSNAETAARLYISRKAVEFHLTNIYTKLGISSRRALATSLGTAGVPGRSRMPGNGIP